MICCSNFQLVIIAGHRAGFRDAIILKMGDEELEAPNEPIETAEKADEVARVEDVWMQNKSSKNKCLKFYAINE